MEKKSNCKKNNYQTIIQNMQGIGLFKGHFLILIETLMKLNSENIYFFKLCKIISLRARFYASNENVKKCINI